jgi:fatty acid-binding protein DegV
VDQRVKYLMKELGEAINQSLSNSEQIAEVISKIKAGGYDVFLVLEATIGFSPHQAASGDQPSLVNTRPKQDELKVNAFDLEFLKSLRIKMEGKG